MPKCPGERLRWARERSYNSSAGNGRIDPPVRRVILDANARHPQRAAGGPLHRTRPLRPAIGRVDRTIGVGGGGGYRTPDPRLMSCLGIGPMYAGIAYT